MEELAFLPGSNPDHILPLDRFLPPVPTESALNWLAENAEPGCLLLDPFGASLRLSLDLARAGYRVLVAANNPVTRLILETLASAPDPPAMTTALAHLASARSGEERLEPQLLALYHTPCRVCGELVSADEFLWERDAAAPFARIYACPHCGDSGEYPATPFDAELARKASATRLNYARILERVAGLNDPDRTYAEEAIKYYPPRAIYALGILINKLDALPEQDLQLVSAMLLTAFDRTNTLWPYPTPRPRPRQLTVPPRFRERNVFRALEKSIPVWTRSGVRPIRISTFPDALPAEGGICLFEGAIRDLAGRLPDLDVAAVVTVLPRPNQAFWQLSALWAGWLGGRDAVKPFKPVLRRQRYDWRWHTTALHAALSHLVPQLKHDTPYFGLVVEAEPGLLGSAWVAARYAGLSVAGYALREEAEIAQIVWKKRTNGDRIQADEDEDQVRAVTTAATKFLAERGEPAQLLPILSAVLQDGTALPPVVELDSRSPSDDYAKLNENLLAGLTYRGGFLRYNAGKELDIGAWWLRNEPATVPLGDRVEAAVRSLLHEHPGQGLPEIDRAICRAFPGLSTPDHSLVSACVESYAVQAANNGWILREEDDPTRRLAEVNDNRARLIRLGQSLGFEVRSGEAVRWEDAAGIYLFHITTSAELGRLLLSADRLPGRKIIVLPGSRSNLVLYKRRRDPRLDFLLKDWYFLKFRHLRALLANPMIDRSNVEAQFLMDELTYESPQLQLF